MKKLFTLLLMLIFISSIAQDQIYVHTATAANSSGNVTYIDNPLLNGNSAAGVVYVHAWNPNGLTSVYNDNVTGLWYSSGQAKWAIYNEDLSPIVEGSHYNVYIASNPAQVITHISTAANQGTFGAYTTVIDNANTNNLNPGPYAVMSHYYNPNAVYNTQNFAFYYDTALNKRGIFDENATPSIPTGAAFRILLSGSGATRFTHTATAANISGNYTLIDNAALNGNPNASFVFSHYWGVNGAPSQVNIDGQLSIWYSTADAKWSIYTEDTSLTIPENIAFDIIVVPQQVLGTGDATIVAAEISMFPNPASNLVTISANQPIDSVTLYNMLGQEVATKEGNQNTLEMNISELSSGVYLAKINASGSLQSLQLVKE